jgi:putative FmdB family regulatory protein
MPIYEYRCSACGAEHEALQRFSDPLLVTCPGCGKETLVKKVSAAGFQLKGSGWYVTDFRNGSKAAKSEPKTDAPPAAEGAKKDGDAKPGGEAKKDTPAPAAAKSESTTAGSTSATPSKPASSE